MKTVSIYNIHGLVASKKVRSEKEAQRFINNTIPSLKMEDKINQGWKVFTN